MACATSIVALPASGVYRARARVVHVARWKFNTVGRHLLANLDTNKRTDYNRNEVKSRCLSTEHRSVVHDDFYHQRRINCRDDRRTMRVDSCSWFAAFPFPFPPTMTVPCCAPFGQRITRWLLQYLLHRLYLMYQTKSPSRTRQLCESASISLFLQPQQCLLSHLYSISPHDHSLRVRHVHSLFIINEEIRRVVKLIQLTALLHFHQLRRCHFCLRL